MNPFSTLKFLLGAATISLLPQVHAQSLRLEPIGTYSTGLIDESAAEIVDYDASTSRVYSTNAAANSVDIIDVSDPTNPVLYSTVDMSPYGGGVNSVVVLNGAIATAVEGDVKTDKGLVVFFDLNGTYLNQVMVGSLPDMITKTPDGTKLLVANEGEPIDYLPGSVDPEGSISIIDITGGIAALTAAQVTNVEFDGYTPAMLPGVRIFGPNASVAQDMEPEYITVSQDSQTAFAACQENNAVVKIDLNTNTIISINSLGLKDHSLPGNGLDASNQDGMINIANWPVKGLYLADAITSYTVGGQTYVVYANEGDARDDWDGYTEGIRIGNAGYPLDPFAFPDAAYLKQNTNLGRLTASKGSGDMNGDGLYEEIHVMGGRSFSIRDANGVLIYDSGDDFEQITAQRYPDHFNASNSNNNFDNRSDDKGPEPEAVEVAFINGRHFAFIGLERIGGIMIYDITDPTAPIYIDYVNNRDFSGSIDDGTAGDSGVENLRFVHADESPNGQMLLISSNEVSGTVTLFQVDYLFCEAGNGILRERAPNGNGDVTIMELSSFESPQNDGDHFVATLSGLICPPVSGYYRFMISADHRAELFLGQGTQPMNGPAIAKSPAPVAPHVYDQFNQQRSELIWLEAGELRHLHAVHREVNGPDHVSVAWERADGIYQDPIPGYFFSQPMQHRALVDAGESDLVQAQLTIYPNPVSNELKVNFTSLADGTAHIQVMDQTGRSVLTTSTATSKDGNTISLDVSMLRSGAYNLSITMEGEHFSQRFVVLH